MARRFILITIRTTAAAAAIGAMMISSANRENVLRVFLIQIKRCVMESKSNPIGILSTAVDVILFVTSGMPVLRGNVFLKAYTVRRAFNVMALRSIRILRMITVAVVI